MRGRWQRCSQLFDPSEIVAIERIDPPGIPSVGAHPRKQAASGNQPERGSDNRRPPKLAGGRLVGHSNTSQVIQSIADSYPPSGNLGHLRPAQRREHQFDIDRLARKERWITGSSEHSARIGRVPNNETTLTHRICAEKRPLELHPNMLPGPNPKHAQTSESRGPTRHLVSDFPSRFWETSPRELQSPAHDLRRRMIYPSLASACRGRTRKLTRARNGGFMLAMAIVAGCSNSAKQGLTTASPASTSVVTAGSSEVSDVSANASPIAVDLGDGAFALVTTRSIEPSEGLECPTDTFASLDGGSCIGPGERQVSAELVLDAVISDVDPNPENSQRSSVVVITLSAAGAGRYNAIAASCFNNDGSCPSGAVAAIWDSRGVAGAQVSALDFATIKVSGLEPDDASDLLAALRR